jgi:glycosyltransferase involved in cell wall biosynthesis
VTRQAWDGPTVSVIIIFHNAAPFLGEAVGSVLAQSFKSWELLLVDDGSTDASSSIAQAIARRLPTRVQYLEHAGRRNLGMSTSRNVGIARSSGRLLAFLDADDAWLPHTLADQVRILDSHPEAAMVYGPIQWWYSWSGRDEDDGRDRVEELGVSPGIIRPPTLVPLFLRDKAAVPSGIMVRREVAEHVGGFEDGFRGEYEDQVFCAKVCLAYAVVASGTCWYRYRQHPDSAVAIGLRTGATEAARLLFLSWLATYLRSRRIRSRKVWVALRIELWRLQHPRSFHWAHRVGRLTAQLPSVVLRRRSGP